MCHAYNEKQKTANDGRNRTTKSRQNQNAQRKGNFKISRNIESRHHQTCGDERIFFKKNTLRKRKSTRIKTTSKE